MCREDLNIDPRLIHGTDAARAEFGKTGFPEVFDVIIVNRVERDQLVGGIGFFGGDKGQVVVSQRDDRGRFCRGRAGDNGRCGQSGTSTKCRRTTQKAAASDCEAMLGFFGRFHVNFQSAIVVLCSWGVVFVIMLA